MHYVHAGSGRPLLLIHGLVGSTVNWGRNVPALAVDAHVYALDLVNVGLSQRVAGIDAGLGATADRIVGFMDALGLDQADIVGHSHGGALALMLAARHSERVRSLVLFAPANPFSDSSDTLVRVYSTTMGRQIARLAPYLPAVLQRFALGRMYGDPRRIAPDCLPAYIKELRMPGTVDHILAIVRGWFGDMAALKAALPLVAELPTLLVWGDRDRAVSLASGYALHRELSNSELTVIAGAGHILFEELPREANRIMLGWLTRLERPAAARYSGSVQSSREQRHTVAARSAVAPALQQVSRGA